jgi:hypothetical protein
VDGWVSLEVSPLLAHDTAGTLAGAKELFARANRPNLLIKIPGTREGLPAIEEAIFSGVPVNVTLLFSREQYVAAAEAFLRGIERRIAAGLNPNVGSVASVFISYRNVAVAPRFCSVPLCALDIVAQCRGLLLHYPQPVFDDVADRYDADQLIPLDYRNVSELACGHPLHDGDSCLNLPTGRNVARHDLSQPFG